MNDKQNKKVLITGGHLAPALAVIEELKVRAGWDVFWVGRRFAMEVGEVPSLEYEIIPSLGIPFFDLKTGRLQRHLTPQTLPSLLRVIPGFFQALKIVNQVRPDVILSFGGYISVPVVISAWLFRIPIVVHEQTTVSGLANRIIARFANKVAISFRESAKDFPKEKIILTGNPVSKSIINLNKFVPGGIDKIISKTKTIYITGGGQGSQTINNVIEVILPELVKKFTVIHQTGSLDYPHFREVAKKLKNYVVKSTVTREEVADILKKASLVISRGGANTICEIAAVGTPAIIIPIPWSERNEQGKNAQALARTGLARVISQKNLSSSLLLENINELISNPPSFEAMNAAGRLVNPEAASMVVDIVEEVSKS